MPSITRKRTRGNQEERPYPVPDQVFMGRPGPVPRGQGRGRGRPPRSVGAAAMEDRIDQLAADVEKMRQEVRNLMEMLADQRPPRQDQAPPAPPAPQATQAPSALIAPPQPQKQLPPQQGQYVTVTLHDFRRNNPPIFTGVDFNSDP